MAPASSRPENVGYCKSIFVSWVWMIGIITGLFAVGITAAWTGGVALANNRSILANHEQRLGTVEIQTSKIDTVLTILREIKKSKE